MLYCIMDILFKAITHELRRDVLTLLSCNNLDTREIRLQFNLNSPTLSNHLKILVTSGLVKKN